MTQIDDFKIMSLAKIKWLPFIGTEFHKIPYAMKILVVGESHYKYDQANSIERLNQKDFTRYIVGKHGIEEKRHSKIFGNFHKTLFAGRDFSTSKFWNSLAFYNFIQRPMETKKDRPTKKDFLKGWEVFFEILPLLKPSICIFIGTTASKYIRNATENASYTLQLAKGSIKINNTFPRIGHVKGEHQAKIIFIRHTSSYYSWSQWNKYLVSELTDEIDWLQKRVMV